MGDVIQFKGKEEVADKFEPFTAYDFGHIAREYRDMILNGDYEDINPDMLCKFLDCLSALDPLDFDDETGLPLFPLPGLEYDLENNRIIMQWNPRRMRKTQ
jgi:hypothetical protein